MTVVVVDNHTEVATATKDAKTLIDNSGMAFTTNDAVSSQ